MNYHVRAATLADADVLVRHRAGMFDDIGLPAGDGSSFRAWLEDMMPAGVYRAWVVESYRGQVVAGGGAAILPWPPGPQHPGGRIAFVYTMYTEPAHVQRGHARRIMDTFHGWCRSAGIKSIGLNASEFGRPLDEALGYRVNGAPMMFLRLE